MAATDQQQGVGLPCTHPHANGRIQAKKIIHHRLCMPDGVRTGKRQLPVGTGRGAKRVFCDPAMLGSFDRIVSSKPLRLRRALKDAVRSNPKKLTCHSSRFHRAVRERRERISAAPLKRKVLIVCVGYQPQRPAAGLQTTGIPCPPFERRTTQDSQPPSARTKCRRRTNSLHG